MIAHATPTAALNAHGVKLHQICTIFFHDRSFWEDAAIRVEVAEREAVEGNAILHCPRCAWELAARVCNDSLFSKPLTGIARSQWGSA